MKTTLTLILTVLAFNSFAFEKYYPLESINVISDPTATKDEIRQTLFDILNKIHLTQDNEHDLLVEECPAKATCISQKENVSYRDARIVLFGTLHLEEKNGTHFINDVYCNKTIGQKSGVGPGKIPDPNTINCEHTWPQSKFTSEFSAGLQKSDLHHLYPTDMKANSTRSNFPFADVKGKTVNSSCLDSKIGTAIGAHARSFEPPLEHKGNVARAMFYFSVRYNIEIPAVEKKYLTEWNKIDPVDEEERIRNQKIMDFQGNRNPFIDYPELIERI